MWKRSSCESPHVDLTASPTVKMVGSPKPRDLITNPFRLNQVFLRLLTLQGLHRSQSRLRTRPCTDTCLRSTGGRRRTHLQTHRIYLMNIWIFFSLWESRWEL